MSGPKILLVDIETAPMLGNVWKLWENDIPLNMLHKDWHLLSWAAKWLGDPASKTMYADQRDASNVEDDKAILKPLWKLLNTADIMLSHNGKSFDHRKINARFILQGFPPPSSYRHLDTLQIARKHFAFTSNKLEYLSQKLGVKHKKLVQRKFSGFELWRECLAGNLAAWKEMELYNKIDVLALEELYARLAPWDHSINFGVYTDGIITSCSCGSDAIIKIGTRYTNAGKFQRFRCTACGKEQTGRKNLLSKAKRKSLMR